MPKKRSLESAGISDAQYLQIMERVAEQNYKDWGLPNSDAALVQALNDNTYNYRGYYNKYPNGKGNAVDHWTDEFKTVYHPTFSNESIYSGKKSQYNPNGLKGGHWRGETFIPANWQRNKFRKGGSTNESAGTSDFPIIVNGQPLTIKQCAEFAHGVLRNAGYLAQGNAWDSTGSDVVYSGYNPSNRPETFDSLAVLRYNNAASDSVYKNFDSNTLDVSKPYLVNMYYKGSKHLREAYENGTKDRAGTHTGYLIHDGNQWNVVHNIDGTAHVDKFTNVQGGNKKYGVTSIFAPRKNTVWNTVRTRLGFENGGSIHIAPSKRGTFTAAATKHGMGVQEFASRVLRNKDSYSPAMVKKANFARNASKWNH